MVCSASHFPLKPFGAIVVLIAMACFAPQKAWAGQAPPTITNGGAKIFVNFADQQQSKIVCLGILPLAPGLTLDKTMISLNVGGIMRSYTLSPDGEGVATPDLFQLRETPTGYAFVLSTLDNSLATAYQQYGFINQDSSNVAASVPISVTYNNVTYTATLSGVYDAKVGVIGKAFLGLIMPPKDPFAVVTHVETLAATPNPSKANQAIAVKGTVSLKNFTGTVAASMHFGDQSPPIHVDGTTFQSMLKAGISHTYTAEGVYVARVTLTSGDEIADTRLFIIVGDGFVVNSQSGAVGRLVKTPGGGVTLQVGVGNVPGAQSAQTNFLDMNGRSAGVPPAPPPPGGQVGLAPSNTFTLPGIYVAKAQATDQGGGALATLRKTIVISASDIGMSAVQNADGTEAIAPRDTSTTDSTITLTSMSGKFFFTSTKSDTVIFNGKITLPAGFNPKSSTGNDITVALGNVTDTIHLNSKNKLTFPTSEGYIKRFQMTVPKLPSGVATGTETAKVSLTMYVAQLDVLGFNSEGISVSLRSDETGQTSVARFIQVDMLIGGKSYSSLIQVSYATSTSTDLGTISGRSSK